MSSSCLFDLFPTEIIRDIGIHFPLVEIPNISQICKKFNQSIGLNEDFWHKRFVLDYEYDPIDYRGSWKELYKKEKSKKVWTFGYNQFGQLGLGDNEDRNLPTEIENFRVKEVSGGACHMVVIDMENNVWTFGCNGSGQLGLGDNQDTNVPTQISNLKVRQVSCGEIHTVIIDIEDNVWTFGWNEYGQLGLGDNKDRNQPTQVLNMKAHQVSAGDNHTVIIDLENNVWTCGWNGNGQLGLGNNKNRKKPTKIPKIKAKQVSTGGDHTVIIDLENNVWTFGSNGFGQLGLGENETRTSVCEPTQVPNIKAHQVSAGGYHTVIIDLNSNVWTCGDNDEGQLGLGDNENRTSVSAPTQVPNLKGKEVSTGAGHTVIIDLEKNIWTFGDNESGELGLEDKENRNQPTQIKNFKGEKVSAGVYHTIMIGTRII